MTSENSCDRFGKHFIQPQGTDTASPSDSASTGSEAPESSVRRALQQLQERTEELRAHAERPSAQGFADPAVGGERSRSHGETLLTCEAQKPSAMRFSASSDHLQLSGRGKCAFSCCLPRIRARLMSMQLESPSPATGLFGHVVWSRQKEG